MSDNWRRRQALKRKKSHKSGKYQDESFNHDDEALLKHRQKKWPRRSLEDEPNLLEAAEEVDTAGSC